MWKEKMESVGTAVRREWDTAAAADNLVKLAALLAAALLVSAYSALPGLAVFGHDEVHYYPDYSFVLLLDGRWINHLLHDFLRSVPPGAWAALFLALSWWLAYRLARFIAFEPAFAALVASTIVLANPFVEQSLWPATAIPAVAMLLGMSFLVERGVPHPVVYLLSGVLIFGSLQTFYFLLPLFFLDRFLAEPGPGENRWKGLFSHLAWWVAGSVAGALVMSTALWVMAGHFGPEPAEWRLTRPVNGLERLIENVQYVSGAFVLHMDRLLRLGGVTWLFLVVLALGLIPRVRALLAMRHAMLLLAAVVFSFFVFSVPLAPQIAQRSLVAMAAAVVLLLAVAPGPAAPGRAFAALLLLYMGHAFSVRAEFYLDIHEARTGYFRDKLEQLIPGHPMTYSAIALDGTMDAARLEAVTFNDPSQMHAIVLSLRTQLYLDCRVPERCEGVGSGTPVAELPFAGGRLRFEVDGNNVGIVRYVE